MARWAKLRSEAVNSLLLTALNSELSKALPLAMNQAGIPLELVRPYIPKLLPVIATQVANSLTQGFAKQQLGIFANENTPMIQQLLTSSPGLFNGAVKPIVRQPQVKQNTSAPAVSATALPVAPTGVVSSPTVITPVVNNTPPSNNSDSPVLDNLTEIE